jgi:hypothetical protein
LRCFWKSKFSGSNKLVYFCNLLFLQLDTRIEWDSAQILSRYHVQINYYWHFCLLRCLYLINRNKYYLFKNHLGFQQNFFPIVPVFSDLFSDFLNIFLVAKYIYLYVSVYILIFMYALYLMSMNKSCFFQQCLKYWIFFSWSPMDFVHFRIAPSCSEVKIIAHPWCRMSFWGCVWQKPGTNFILFHEQINYSVNVSIEPFITAPFFVTKVVQKSSFLFCHRHFRRDVKP